MANKMVPFEEQMIEHIKSAVASLGMAQAFARNHCDATITGEMKITVTWPARSITFTYTPGEEP